MRFIHPISRRTLVLAGNTCAALALLGIVPWQVVAQGAKTNRILFVSNRMDAQRFSIFAMDSDGSHVVRLSRGLVSEFEVVSAPNGKATLRPSASHRNAMEFDPVLSPDGKRIAFTLAVSEKPEQGSPVKMNLCVMNADGSDRKQVTYFTYGLQATTPAWSPDAKEIAFALQSRNDRAPGGLDTTICVTDLKNFRTVAEGMWPSWSPDGKTILYVNYDKTGLTTDLYERKSNGAGEKKKLLEGVLQAALSPDGKRLAYIAINTEPGGDRTGNIVVSNADGSQPQQVTRLREMGAVGFQWSADGRQIYFARPTSPDAANYRIYVMDADGSHLQAVTKGDAPDYLGAAPGPRLANRWMDRIITKR